MKTNNNLKKWESKLLMTLNKIHACKTIGDFYQRPKEQVVPGEKAKPVRQTDNLHPEGQFYDRPQQAAPMKGDRADIRKPQDNLKPEGTCTFFAKNIYTD